MRRLWSLLEEFIWPRRTVCLCCKRPSRGSELCADCEAELASLAVPGPLCPVCGHTLKPDGRCAFCDQTGAVRLRAVWAYRGPVRELVRLFKFHGLAEAGFILADGVAEEAAKLSLPPETAVTWVTMPKRRLRARGIDHGQTLAREAAKRLSLPVRQLLTRSETIAVEPQVGKNRQERLSRLQGAFSCEEAVTFPVLLIDDVLTTGATARACVECLLEAGAPSVTVVTAAQTLLDDQSLPP